MKLCMAQMCPGAGRVGENVEVHLKMARYAASLGADMIVFSELSLTGYEPKLSRNLAMEMSDPHLELIQSASAAHQIAISVGLPLKDSGLPRIGMATFYPDGTSQEYSKQRLYADETTYFSSGTRQTILEFNGTRMIPGICYETRFDEMFEQAQKLGAKVYVASAAKPRENIRDAYEHYSKMSKRYSIITAFSNGVGPADESVSVGMSAAWGTDGQLLASLDDKSSGLVLIDTTEQTAESIVM